MCFDKFVKYILILVKKKNLTFLLKKIGGTMLAARLALEYGLACSTAGGTHHAFPSHGSGFCMLNDLAVTAKDMIDSQVVDKILIVDLDVHQVI